jgi:rhodanese-related sulfurtransferase
MADCPGAGEGPNIRQWHADFLQGNVVVVDVREPAEWKGGVVEGALLLPLSALKTGNNAAWDEAITKHARRPWIIYCRTGNRSGMASKILRGRGLETRNGGGFHAWKSAGVPVEIPRAR